MNKNMSKREIREARKKKRSFAEERELRNARSTGGDKEYSNDPQWYFKDATLAQFSGNLNFTWPAGANVPIPVNNFSPDRALTGDDIAGTSRKFNYPTLMTLRVYPTVGNSLEMSSALNYAAAGLKAYQRSTNSGGNVYDAPDLMMYLLANADIYSYIMFLQRIIAIGPTVNQLNWTYPDTLYLANCVDPVDIVVNRPNLIAGVQQIIVRASQLVVPDATILPLFARRVFMYSGLYIESDSAKDQLYMYTPGGFLKFGLDAEGKGTLFMERNTFKPGAKLTVDQLISYGMDMVNKIQLDETTSIMSGDLLKAYGDKRIKLAPVNENAILTPSFNIEVLEQIKNATAVGEPIGLDIYQTADVATASPFLKSCVGLGEPYRKDLDTSLRNADYVGSWALTQARVINTASNIVNPALVVENTRLMAQFANTTSKQFEGLYDDPIFAHQWGADTTYFGGFEKHTLPILLSCGSEVVEGIYTWNPVDKGKFDRFITYHSVLAEGELTARYKILLGQWCAISRFKYAPMIQEILCKKKKADQDWVVTNMVGEYIGEIYDYDNYAIVDKDSLQRLHDTCLLSLLNVAGTAISFENQH